MRLRLASVLLLLPLLTNAQRFVRFISTDNKEYYGDAILPSRTTDASKSTTARVITGDILGDFTITNQVKVYNAIEYLDSSQIINIVLCSLSKNFSHLFRTNEFEQ